MIKFTCYNTRENKTISLGTMLCNVLYLSLFIAYDPRDLLWKTADQDGTTISDLVSLSFRRLDHRYVGFVLILGPLCLNFMRHHNRPKVVGPKEES